MPLRRDHDAAAGRRAFRRAVLIACGTAVLTSCRSSTDPHSDLAPGDALTTDSTAYHAELINAEYHRYRFTVISRFDNVSDTAVFIGRCFPTSPGPTFGVFLTSPAGGESGYDPVWGCVGHDQQFEVLPGAVRYDTLVVEGPNAYPSGSTVGIGRTSGTFRLWLDVRTARGDGAPRAYFGLSLSNAFVVTTP